MTTSDSPSVKGDFGQYRMIRDEIAHEDNLMGSRVSWFMASQSFLLTALAIAQGSERQFPNSLDNYFFPFLPIVAIISDLLIFVGVIAGIHAVRRWRALLFDENSGFDAFPKLHRSNFVIALGWSGPLGLPLVFLFGWIYVLWKGSTVY